VGKQWPHLESNEGGRILGMALVDVLGVIVGLVVHGGPDRVDRGWDIGVGFKLSFLPQVLSFGWGFGRTVPLRPWPAVRRFTRGKERRRHVLLAWCGFSVCLALGMSRG
jgi:hypothetical protein